MGEPLWDERRATIGVVDELLHCRLRRLSSGGFPVSSAVYMLFMDVAPFAAYRAVARCRWPVYAGKAATDAEARLHRHAINLALIPNLSEVTFWVATLPMPSASAAGYGESLAIDAFAPVWNVVLPGLSSTKQGGSRQRTQKAPRWAVVHPGGATGMGKSRWRPEVLKVEVQDHLERTVPMGTGWLLG